VVAGSTVVAKDIKFACELRIWGKVNVSAHQLAAARANISQVKDVGVGEALLHGGVPFVGSGQNVVRIYHDEKRYRRRCRKRGWCGLIRSQWERKRAAHSLLQVGRISFCWLFGNALATFAICE